MKLVIFALAVLSGCQTADILPKTESLFQKDLTITEGGIQIVGLGVLPAKDEYKFEIKSRHNPDIVRISNCHRDLPIRDQKKNFQYAFIPNKLIEKGSCVLRFTFLDSKGYHQFGAVAFKEPEDNLAASISCNGAAPYEMVGDSTCQGKAGTIQVISFKEETKVQTVCPMPRYDADFGRWYVTLPEGDCLYRFSTKGGEYHKLVTFGYNDIINQ